MEICWNNLEGLRFTRNGVFIKKERDSYIEIDGCKRCGNSYLTLKHRPSEYCSRSCFLKDRKHTKEAKNNMSVAKKGKAKVHGAYLLNKPAYVTYAERLWCDEINYTIYRGVKLLTVACVSCGKKFVPNINSVVHRVRYLEGKETCESKFYCSDECKKVCPYFGQHKYPKDFDKSKEFTAGELNVWRKEVLKRADYKCEICDKKANHAHHIQPKKVEPGLALDPDNGVALCKKCHYEYGHKDECSTGILSIKIC